MKTIRPMLAAQYDDWLLSPKFPIYAQPKIDGVRCLVVNGKPQSRSGKLLPNLELQRLVEEAAWNIEGLDGEICGASFQKAHSTAMTADKPLGNVKFVVFDNWRRDMPYKDVHLHMVSFFDNYPWLDWLGRTMCHSTTDIDAAHARHLRHGYEGTILRSPDAPYKNGKSTAKQGYLIKRKDFKEAEATIVGFNELMQNANESTINELGYAARSSHKAGKVGLEMLGSFDVVNKDGVRFSVGTGFTEVQRKAYWSMGPELLALKTITYKYLDYGIKNRPRHPVFKGFRNDGE